MRSRRTLLIILSVVALLVGTLLLALQHFAQPTQAENVGTDAISALFAASYPDVQSVSQPLSQWRNRVVIVNFWASWCPPCRDEMPDLSALQDRYRSRDVVVLGISTDDVAKMQEYAREAPVNYPLLAGADSALDLAIAMGDTQRALPYTVVLGRDGSVAASHLGRIDPQSLEAALIPLL